MIANPGNKSIISYYIPKHRQRLLFDGKEIVDKYIVIKSLHPKVFEFLCNNKTIDNDFVEIEVLDQRKLCSNGKFNLNVDIYGDLFEQICKLKNITKNNSYLLYNGKNYFDIDEFEIYKDYSLGKKLKIDLYINI